jgi:hypothetical protein
MMAVGTFYLIWISFPWPFQPFAVHNLNINMLLARYLKYERLINLKSIFSGFKCQSMKYNANLHIVPKLNIFGALFPDYLMPLWGKDYAYGKHFKENFVQKLVWIFSYDGNFIFVTAKKPRNYLRFQVFAIKVTAFCHVSLYNVVDHCKCCKENWCFHS